MRHPFAELEPGYAKLLSSVKINKSKELDNAVAKLKGQKSTYLELSKLTGVPPALIAALHWLESSGDLGTNLANGDPLTGPTKNEPTGRPPLGQKPNDRFPVSFIYAATDALHYDHLDDVTAPWTIYYAMFKAEAYNGFGPRDHGINPHYLWGGTDLYTGGGYPRDGVWDPNYVSKQLGVVPIMLQLAEADADFVLPTKTDIELPGTNTPSSAPIGVGVVALEEGSYDIAWVQRSLNDLAMRGMFKLDAQLIVDGNFGRRSRAAVRAFQDAAGITVDGLIGQKTIAAIKASASNAKPTPKPSQDTLALKIVKALRARGDSVLIDGMLNNVYVEGMDLDGRDNGNCPNQFNDANFLIEIAGGLVPKIVYAAEATDEPGRYWTEHPMNAGGAARIALGQQDCWTPGTYHDKPAWIQDKPVRFYRDAAKLFKRAGSLRTDMIGLHQHQGYDLPHDDLGHSSAGCLVRRKNEQHLEFMRLTTANGRKRLLTSVIDAATVLGATP